MLLLILYWNCGVICASLFRGEIQKKNWNKGEKHEDISKTPKNSNSTFPAHYSLNCMQEENLFQDISMFSFSFLIIFFVAAVCFFFHEQRKTSMKANDKEKKSVLLKNGKMLRCRKLGLDRMKVFLTRTSISNRTIEAKINRWYEREKVPINSTYRFFDVHPLSYAIAQYLVFFFFRQFFLNASFFPENPSWRRNMNERKWCVYVCVECLGK